MSDLINRNAKAAQQGLDLHEDRIKGLEDGLAALRNEVQTLIGMMHALQQSNALALQSLRGTGPTANGDER